MEEEESYSEDGNGGQAAWDQLQLNPSMMEKVRVNIGEAVATNSVGAALHISETIWIKMHA